MAAPLPCDDPAALVDGDEHAPAVLREGAVGLHEPVHDAVGPDPGPYVPAPSRGAVECARADAEAFAGLGGGESSAHPVEERVELHEPGAVLAAHGRARIARVAFPSLASGGGEPLFAHRLVAYRAQPRPC